MSSRREQLAADDKTYVWHPFTQMADYVAEEPLIVERGEGTYLVDVDGRRYLDGVSSLWVTVHGHCKPELDAAIVDQLGRIAHSTLLGIGNVPSIELARRLIAVAPPGLAKVFYAENGASAVEIALKMAFQYWRHRGEPRRTRFVSLENAYHGDTLGAVSVGGIDVFHAAFGPLLFPTFRAPSPYCYRCSLGRTHPDCGIACADELGRILADHGEEVAAVIIEPLVQGAAGMLTQPPGYLRRVRELCTRHDVLLIADEVATGFGRTGRLFACEHEEVSPDLLVVGKGITGGYLPLSAVLTTRAVYDAFLGDYAEMKTFFHGHTYTGNPLCCAVAIANLELFEREGTLDALAPRIEQLTRTLDGLRELRHVGEVRQRGFMVGIELVANRATREPYPVGAKIGWRVIAAARRRGAVLRPLGNTIVLMPPLAISARELDELLAITRASILEVTEPE
jgi:adenosylmethionine-8-amino-7-oxononanoate aminotransferase